MKNTFLVPALFLISILMISSFAVAQGASDLVSLGEKSHLLCRVKTKGSQLVVIGRNGKVSVKDFVTEQTKIAKSISSLKKTISSLKAQIKTISKQRRTVKTISQLASKQIQLAAKNKESKRLSTLISSIKACKANKIKIPVQLCGNNIVEPGETCDGNCPTSCPAQGCGMQQLVGSATTCNVSCAAAGTQTACLNGDGCCAAGCNTTNDSDCAAVCGNGVREGSETCDGLDLAGESCLSRGFGSGSLTCSTACLFDSSGCGACSVGQVECGGKCVDPRSDSANCGACGAQCSVVNGTGVCTNGTCGFGACQPGWSDCNNNLSDGCETSLATSLTSCGLCGRVCSAAAHSSPSCNAGVCNAAASCDAGWGNCNGNPADGCETSLMTSPTSCGSCGTVCGGALPHASPRCSAGLCGGLGACDAGWADCNGNPADGCETSLLTSATNCGGCGNACPDLPNAAPSCSGGICGLGSCAIDWGNCDGTSANGCETFVFSSVTNCGACGNVCPTRPHTISDCLLNSCVLDSCESGWLNCNGTTNDGCETSGTSVSNCGVCGAVCSLPNAVSSCATGQCALSSCSFRFCNADGNANNGCEALLDSHRSCASAVFLGNIRGDTGSDAITISGTGDAYFSIRVDEGDGFFVKDLLADITLSVAPGTDYDLEVACSNCGGATTSSLNGVGVDDHVNVANVDDFFTVQSSLLFIHVKYFSANVCAPWGLVIRGNVGSPTFTCG